MFGVSIPSDEIPMSVGSFASNLALINYQQVKKEINMKCAPPDLTSRI